MLMFPANAYAAAARFAARAALAFFRLAASFARAAAESFRFGFGAGAGFADSPWNFAHRAFCASAILLRAAALSVLRFLPVVSEVVAVSAGPPFSMARSSAI